MSQREYYRRWIKTAFCGAPEPIDLWSGIAGAILNVLAHFVPSVQEAIPDLTWQLPLWIAGSIVLARLLLAPYWIAKEDAEKIENQQKEINDLREKIKPQLVLVGVVHDPDLATSPMLVMRHIKIEVRNTGTEILQHCVVALENLMSDKGCIYVEKEDLTTDMTFRAGERKYVEVARFNEGGVLQFDMSLSYASGEIQRTIPKQDAYYFDLVAYSVGSPHSKRYKLYVANNGQLKMEEHQNG